MKVKIQVPESLREISLEQYQKYHKINTDANQNSNFLLHKTVEIFCNLNLQNVIKVQFNSVMEVVRIINDLFNKDAKLVPTFTMDGIAYGFVPDLDKITLGEYIDLDTTLGDWSNMHKAMAVLYRPITQSYKDKYTIEKYTGDKFSDMINMPMDAVFSSILFFYHLGMELSTVMMNSLETQEEEENLVQYLSSIESGDGINQFGVYLDKMLQDLKISLN